MRNDLEKGKEVYAWMQEENLFLRADSQQILGRLYVGHGLEPPFDMPATRRTSAQAPFAYGAQPPPANF